MSDTDVYRVVYECNGTLRRESSNRNSNGLWDNLSSARRAAAQLRTYDITDAKIQKLTTRNGILNGQVAPILEWVDVE